MEHDSLSSNIEININFIYRVGYLSAKTRSEGMSGNKSDKKSHAV
jgi:hypothetical protein